MRITSAILLAGMTLCYANAEMLVNDSFAYPSGNLASKGNWVINGTSGSNPINVIDENLTYSGYQDEASGNAVVLDMELGRNSLQNIFAMPGNDAPESVAYSALVRIDELPSYTAKYGAVMVLTGGNSFDGTMGDGITSSEGCGLYVKKGDDDSHAVLGVSVKGSAMGLATYDVEWCTEEIPVGETVLVALTYAKAGDNYVAKLYVNPTEETSVADATSTMTESTLVDIRGVALCQRNAAVNKNPRLVVDELRVASELKELFSAEQPPVVIPTLNISMNPVNFGQVYTGVTYTKEVIITGTDLEDDITLSLGESGQIELSAATISKEDAMSEAGFTLAISLTPEESRFYSDKITLTTPGVGDRIINVEWHSVPSLVAKTFGELCNEETHDMVSVYVYTGEAVVTFVESYYDLSYDRVVNSIFVQDATGGAELRSATGCGYEEVDITNVKEGDKLTNIAGYLIFGDSGLTFIPRTPDAWEVVSHDNKVEPVDVTLWELAMADDGYVYGNQLVRVKNVYFPDEYYLAGDYHGLWNSQKYQIFDGTLDDYDGYSWMWCNKGADYFKTSTKGYFNHKWNLTGIVNNYYPTHISPRSKADFEDLGEREILDPSGIAEIERDETGAEYFDVLGRRVGNDAKGILIKRSDNGKVTKVIR